MGQAIFETTESKPNPPREDQGVREDLADRLGSLGVTLTSVSFERALERARQTRQRTGALSEAQLRSIVEDVVSGTEILQGVTESYQ